LFVILAIFAPFGLQAARADEFRHTVAPGETLFRIALRYGVSVQALANANGITNVNVIQAGQRLIIPGKAAEPAPQAEQPAQPAQVAEAQAPTLPTAAKVDKVAVPGATGADLVSAFKTVGAAPLTVAGRQPERTHVVKRGEGLARIAGQYGMSWEALANYNSIANPNLIYTGMILKIPPADYNPAALPGNPSGIPGAPLPNGKVILVILRQQRVYAYKDGVLLRNVLVSTGLPATPTVVGNFKVYVKYRAQTMYGPGYYLPSVPFVMYFHLGYGLHGTYWHSNWGRPMSHGCVNLPTPEAEWLYNFAEVGTPVIVQR
jgi:LysM repeat protein